MALHRKIDNSHKEIVTALRKIGASVQSLASVGDGCPDLLVGFDGKTFLLEVKSMDTYYGSNCVLTTDQQRWWSAWRGGELYLVHTALDAIKVVMGVK